MIALVALCVAPVFLTMRETAPALTRARDRAGIAAD
jgi:hypothetical protein